MTFDHLLQPGATAAANWTGVAKFNAAGTSVSGFAPGTVLGTVVAVPMQRVGPGALPQAVDYLAVPPDIVSNRGIPAAPFAGFPLTMLP